MPQLIQPSIHERPKHLPNTHRYDWAFFEPYGWCHLFRSDSSHLSQQTNTSSWRASEWMTNTDKNIRHSGRSRDQETTGRVALSPFMTLYNGWSGIEQSKLATCDGLWMRSPVTLHSSHSSALPDLVARVWGGALNLTTQ